ncbi:MAG TPA: DUF1674 domain-containing protein [Gammaproteobacteria bacterium]|nr:DUF1674 domain-containing protein [Gammaproteobacteria bacterium]
MSEQAEKTDSTPRPEALSEAGEASGSRVPKETGGRPGPDPVRYGDWEKNGRCIDF